MHIHKLKQSAYLKFTIIFLLIVLIIFAPTFITGNTLIWNADGITQHYPALLMWREQLRTIIFHHHWTATWSWHLGLGADTVQTFSYYNMGDIFTYPVALISKTAVPFFYSVMVIVRLWLAGLAFIWATKRLRPTSNFAQTIGAICYTFSGYTAFATFEHPFFINPLIIFPLLIVAIQRATLQQRYFSLTIMVGWTALSNIYFAFMLGCATLLYWFWLLVTNQTARQPLKLLKTIGAGLLGIGLSLPLALPAAYAIFNSARAGKSLANGLIFYPLNYYLSLPGMLIGNLSTPDFWFTGGFSIIGIFALIFILRRLSNRWLRIVSCFAIIAVLVFPWFAGIMNGFSSPSNRWTLVLLLPIGIATTYLIDHYNEITPRDQLWWLVFSVIATISLFYTSKFSLQTSFGLFIALLVSFLFIGRYRINSHWFLTGLVLVNAILVVGIHHQRNTNPQTSQMLSAQSVKELTNNQGKYQNSDTDFQRAYIDNQLGNVTGISPASNLPSLSAVHNIESYWSIQNKSVGTLMNKLGIANSSPNDVVTNADYRSVLLNVLGVNQLFMNQDSERIISNYENQNLPLVNQQNVLTSALAYPLFYETPAQMTPAQFMRLSQGQREAALADTTVLNAPITKHKSALASQVQIVQVGYNDQTNYQSQVRVKWSNHPQLLPNSIFIAGNKQLKGTELHLEITNLKGAPYSAKQQLKHDWQTNQFNQQMRNANPQNTPNYRYNQASFTWDWLKKNATKLDQPISGYTLTTDYLGQQTSFTQSGQNNLSFYNPKRSITLNLGPAKQYSSDQFIPLSFDKPGNYIFTVRIEAVPVDHRFAKIAKHIQKDQPTIKTGHNMIQIKLAQPAKRTSILASSVPYSSGWHATGADVIKVNFGFIGLRVHKGQQTITLHYQTPLLKVGLWGASIALVICVLLLTLRFTTNKQR